MAKLHLDFIWLGAGTWWCSGIMQLRYFLPVLISVVVFFLAIQRSSVCEPVGDVSRYGSESAHGYSTGFFNQCVSFLCVG